MRRINIAIVVIALLAVVGAGAGLGLAASAGAATRGGSGRATASAATARTSTSTSVATVASSSHPPKYVVADCSQLQVKPASYFFACADGNAGLQGLHWTTWSAKLASGYGTYYYNDCTPTCVAGHFHLFPALVVLWGSSTVQGHPGVRRYTEFTLIFTGKRPPVYHSKNGKTYTTYPVTQTFPAPPLLG